MNHALITAVTRVLGYTPTPVPSADLVNYARSIANSPDAPDSFSLIDLTSLRDRYQLWREHLPEVEPFYAVKANPDPAILATLAALGTSFDVASSGEIAAIRKIGVSGERMIFAHPRKSERSIASAPHLGLTLLVIDSYEEAEKILACYPGATLILRLRTDDAHARVPLGEKFGAPLDLARNIVERLAAAGCLALLGGIAFHVGSNALDPQSFATAIKQAGELFTYTKSRYDHDLALLDIGGGWPGTDDRHFAACTQVSRAALHDYIPPTTRIIAEPGRFFATQTMLCATRIIGKSTHHEPGARERAYYLADGVYGSFHTALTYHHDRELTESEGFRFAPLNDPRPEAPLYRSRLWGPTCDPYDYILDLPLPDLACGSYLYTINAGAYSLATRTNFNGIEPPCSYYLLAP